MKNKCLWIICCIFVLTACKQKNESELIIKDTLEETKSRQKIYSEENGQWQKKDSDSEKVLNFVTGMKIVLPDEWVGNVEISVWPSLEDYGGKLAISEKQNLEAGASGDLLYLDYVNKKIAKDKPYQIFDTERVLGVYRPNEETEYALILELPREMTWVEGDKNLKEIYDQFSVQIEELQVITEDISGFTECTANDVEWIEYFAVSEQLELKKYHYWSVCSRESMRKFL